MEKLEKTAGYVFKDRSLLLLALTHASAGAQPDQNNERLEFLGDRVVGLVVAEMLFRACPDETEGALAKRHAALVQKSAMVQVAAALGLETCLNLSAAERRAGGARKNTILGDAVEALVGAIYLDGGHAAAETFVRSFWQRMMETQNAPPQDAKSALQEWAQSRGLPLPVYDVVGRSGADHAPAFEIAVRVQGYGAAVATASTKRAAEKLAAQNMLNKIETETQKQ